MDINERMVGKILVMELKGRLDAVTSPQLRDRINTLVDGGQHHMVIGFENLEYISSAGIRVLLAALAKIRPVNGKIVLASPGKLVEEVFRIAGLYSIFPIYVDEEKAVEDLNATWNE